MTKKWPRELMNPNTPDPNMQMQPFFIHARAFLYAVLTVAVTNAAIAALQYIGAHIPDLIQLLTQYAGAHAALIITQKS